MVGRKRYHPPCDGKYRHLWKAVYNILAGYFDITIANAQKIKNIPGRKKDVSDA